jgi:TonB-linked SusC/RagA family outer membrane protein
MKKNHEWWAHNRYALKKSLTIMKWSLFFIIIGCIQTFAVEATYAQKTKLELNFSQTNLEKVLNEIETQSEFFFLFNQDQINTARKVDIQVKGAMIQEVLNDLFAGTDVTYTIIDKQIVLTNSSELLNMVNQATQQTGKKVTGKVTDSSGGSLPGVSVVVKGTTTGVITDNNGTFSLANIPENATLQFSFVGMKMQENPVSGKSTINVTLIEETIGIEEVIAIGYGTQRKVTSTGSIATTGGEQLAKSPATNLTNDLMGILPGLSAVTNGGEPGSDGAALRIRGSNTLGDNSPLVIVDGVPNRNLSRIESSDIQSLTVLKDASAAIYGSQAANGVILVTTKRGGIGKPKITISINNGFGQPTRTPKMADAASYATLLNEVAYYGTPSLGRNQKYSESDIQKYADGSDPWGHPNTDWIKAVLKPWSNQSLKTASISGGNENVKYFLSLGTRFQDGFYRASGSNYRQYNFRSNIDGKVSKYISINFDLAGTQARTNSPHPPPNKGESELWRAISHFKPNLPGYWPDGTPGPDIELGINPVVTSTDATGYIAENNYTLESNLRTVITIPWVKGLTFNGNVAYDKSFTFNKSFGKPWYLYTWDGNAAHITVPAKKGYVKWLQFQSEWICNLRNQNKRNTFGKNYGWSRTSEWL